MRRLSLLLLLLLLPCVAVGGSGNQTGSVSLQWNGTVNAIGYRIYYGESSEQYHTSVNTGLATTANIGGLQRNRRYYFAATALYSDDESGFSNEVNVRAK